MTVPTKETLTIFKGGRFEHRFLYLNSDDTPVNVTGYTARMHIREDWDSATALVELTTEDNIDVVGGSGAFDMAIPASVTAALTAERGVFDIEIIPPAGDEYAIKLAYGSVKIKPEATRT